jgi:hypothetical protein
VARVDVSTAVAVAPAAAGGPVAADPVTGAEVVGTGTAVAVTGTGETGGPGGEPVIGAGTRVLAVVAMLAAVAVARPGPEIEIEIRVSSQGFDPAVVTLRRGETTRIVLSADEGEHCFAVDALRVEKRVVAGRPTTFDLIADRAGRFPFYCCVETGEAAEVERGEIVVTE